jgi:hypothetical protein
MVALAHVPTVAQRDELTGLELAGRYLIGPPLSQVGTVRIFGATDRWLDREVALALEGVSGKSSLITTGKLVARITSPHVVNVYACGHFAEMSFVVFERPASTLAFVAQEARGYAWNEARANAAAMELGLGLVELHRAGVASKELHLGSIGIDGSGRVRVSPWPLDDRAPGMDEGSPLDDVALIASLFEIGTRGNCSAVSSPDAALPACLRRAVADEAALSDIQFLDDLNSIEVSASGEPTAQVPALPTPGRPISLTSSFRSSVHRGRKRRLRS